MCCALFKWRIENPKIDSPIKLVREMILANKIQVDLTLRCISCVKMVKAGLS